MIDLKKVIKAAEGEYSQILFTPSSLVDFLTQVDELKDVNIGVNDDGENVSISIGDSTYQINPKSVTNIDVSDDDLDQACQANESNYDELEESGSIELNDSVESGIIKQLLKTLAIGGIVRLAAKELKK
nr:MAG TPA: hypothetical protein [Caudoviricetes sp.]